MDRILQGSLGQGKVRRTCRPGSRRRAARRKQAAQCSFPKELNRPSRTISHHRGENATDPRNQPRVASEKRSPAPTEKHTKPQLDATPVESAQSPGESTSDLPPRGALGGLAQTAAALVASAPTSSSGVGRLGDGGRSATGSGARPCASRRASQSSSELDAASGTREASKACAGAGASEASPEGRGVPEAAADARETRERHS